VRRGRRKKKEGEKRKGKEYLTNLSESAVKGDYAIDEGVKRGGLYDSLHNDQLLCFDILFLFFYEGLFHLRPFGERKIRKEGGKGRRRRKRG